ncbi:Methyltransferase type 11 [Neofusicoccum parvum]|uniref:Methyltransferase type 11 n=2 Tax=Neofusicoccum parvum TaxID=310453 RepID=A0ACB5S7V6_9PEZI|nr:putative methyltransferase domain-containing protein [Neofusicoccum parvum UCRNP2]GME28847.1 Methyltransferase type 11 [Neofusicoccum parvum]GME64519.1 Methyltransferase type 11 [Neofusicoccum parvum]
MTSSEQHIEVDAGFEADSTLGVDEQLSAYSQSLTSSVTAYPIENGRRYHAYKDGAYFMPNDENEQDRLDLLHHMVLLVTGRRHFFAPVAPERLRRVLDVGTGTGIWAIEVADRFPGAEVLGNDLSPVQPQWVPPNVRFEVDDCEAPWTHATPFDLIFARQLDGSISDWPALVRNMFGKTRPGGWTELHLFDTHYRSDDGSLPADAYLNQFLATLEEGCTKLGKELYPGPLAEGWMKEAGFVNVHARMYKVPLGPWPKDKKMKEIGLVNLMQYLDGLESFSFRMFTSVLGWKLEEVKVINARVREELKSKTIHPYYQL